MSKLSPYADEIRSLYESGAPSTKIAKQFGVTPPVVLSLLRKLGVSITCAKTSKRVFNDEQLDEIKLRIQDGEDMASIGRSMGTSQTTIDRYARKLGVHKPRKDLQSHAPDILNKLSSGVHVDEVAALYQTTRGAVYSVVDRLGVDLLPITVARRALERPSPEEQQKARWQHEKLRMEENPALRTAHLARQARTRATLCEKLDPIMSVFRVRGCVKCGEKREAALDAHHSDPKTKLFDVGHRNKFKVTPDELEAELDKCICICAYCHRVMHYEQGDNRHTDSPNSKTAKQVALARVRLQPLFDRFYAKGCWVCKRDHPAGLSAHHIDPTTKSFNVSKAFSSRLSNDLVEQELAKCACLCESCHRLVHANELPCPTTPCLPSTSSEATLTSPKE